MGILNIFKRKESIEEGLHSGKIKKINIEKGIVKIIADSKVFCLPTINFIEGGLYKINRRDKIFCTFDDTRIKEIYDKRRILLYKEHIGY